MRGTPELNGVPESSCLVKLTAKNISLNPTTLLKLTSSKVFLIAVLFLQRPLSQKT